LTRLLYSLVSDKGQDLSPAVIRDVKLATPHFVTLSIANGRQVRSFSIPYLLRRTAYQRLADTINIKVASANIHASAVVIAPGATVHAHTTILLDGELCGDR
jgi:hypothetical protein